MRLREKLNPKVATAGAAEADPRSKWKLNVERLTVRVDLGDQWSNYCILDLEGEMLAEGQLRTTQQDFAEFFQALNKARVVVEVGTHSAWLREVIGGCEHEVLVANPRLMEGSKRRKRKNDRIDAHKLARLGRVDPESLHPLQHRSTGVRQDLVLLRARDALVAVRTELINTTRGLVKSMGQRLPRCSSQSFASKAEEGLPIELRAALLPLVQLADALSDCIQEYDRKVEEMASQKYGHTKLLRQVTDAPVLDPTETTIAGADLTFSQGRPLTMGMDEQTSSIGPAGVMAMACRQRRPDATREAPAVIAAAINWQLARARPGCLGWRRGEQPTRLRI
jgi:transposase